MSIKGMQVSLKGVQLLQGGAVTTRGCSCLNCTNQVKYTFCSVGALFAWLVHLRQVHPLSMHFYLVGALETSAPPESIP